MDSTSASPPHPTGAAPGALIYTPAGRTRMRYTYINRQAAAVDLWLALPPALPTQRNVRILALTPEPLAVQPDGLGLNCLAFFRLAAGQRLDLELQADLYHCRYDPTAPGQPIALDPAERARFLRSSALVHVTEEVRAEARRIVGDATTPLEQARRLYVHLIKHYRYVWPPAARGSEAMRRLRRGDCGEYSFLYAAWCRALDLPCRVLIGSFAHGRLQAHVWNEVFIAGLGWLPADSSIHQTPLRLPGLADLDWLLQRVEHQLGRLTDERLAFSIDPEVLLVPPYHDQPAPERAERMRIAGRDLAWGYESLDGAAPYLQPIYLRFNSAAEQPRAGWPAFLAVWWPPLLRRQIEPLLGTWSFHDPLTYRLMTWLMVGGFLVGLLGTVLNILAIEGFDLPKLVGYLIGDILLIQRTGVNWWKLVLIALFLFELIVHVLALIFG